MKLKSVKKKPEKVTTRLQHICSFLSSHTKLCRTCGAGSALN